MAIIFFDAFDDNVLDPVKWTNLGGGFGPSLAEQNGHLEQAVLGESELVLANGGTGPFGLYVADLIGREIVWKMARWVDGGVEVNLYSSSLTGRFGLLLRKGSFPWRWFYEGAQSSVWDIDPPIPVDDQFYDCKIKFVSTTQVEFYVDGVLVKTSDPVVPLTIEPAIFLFQAIYDGGMFNDFVFQDSAVPSGGTKLNCSNIMLM